MVSFGNYHAFIVLLCALIIGMAESHMIMQTPAPYGDPDNSPLSSSGSNYPCKVTSDTATFYSTDGIIDKNTMVAGEAQTLSFKGSAVHGGGSCQLAITNDMQPSASTSWRVILSIESGCPSTDGTNPSTYNYTIPAETEPGQYSFAWTWISKLAGQPEYYMNCAPITVTASSSSKAKRHDVPLEPRADSYPELFVANLESINSCKTTSGTDVVFPDPGENVEKLLSGATPNYATISSSGCVPLSQTQGSGSLPTATAGGSGGSSAATTAAASVTNSASASSPSQTSQSSSAVFAPAATGGTLSSTTLVTTTTAQASSIYVIPVTTHDRTSSTLSSAASHQPSVATGGSSNSSAGGSAASSTKTHPLTAQSITTHSVTAQSLTTHTRSTQTRTTGSVPTATLSPTGGSSSSGSGSSNSTGSTGSTSVKSGACTDEGMFNCVGSDYQQCASGSWTTMQALPAGTTCQQGESEGLWAREVGLKALRKARRGVKFVYVRD